MGGGRTGRAGREAATHSALACSAMLSSARLFFVLGLVRTSLGFIGNSFSMSIFPFLLTASNNKMVESFIYQKLF